MPAIGKSKAKVYSKKNTAKKAFTGHGTRTGPGTVKSKKKYADKLSDTQRLKAKKALTSDKAYTFKEAYAKARGGGSDKFTFKGKSYLAHKPSEKKSLRERLTGYKTQAEYETARTKRKKETRVARMEKRKEEGKSYSAKNLAALKMEKRGSPPKSKYITKVPGKGWRKDIKIPGIKKA